MFDETAPAIEKSYMDLLSKLDRHFAQYDFLLGSQPCKGDFGLIVPLYAHLYRAPYSGPMMEAHAPKVVAWVKPMIEPTPLTGEFLAKDQVPETLLPILQRMLTEQGPVLKQTIDQIAHWENDNTGNEIDRAIGKLKFTIGDTSATRLTFPYMQWMWQRCYDFYHDLADADKRDANHLLSQVRGFEALLNYPIQTRIKPVNNKIQVER